MPEFDWMVMVEKAGEAEWTRCRSLSDRKANATWADQSEEVKNAWRDGAKNALIAAKVPELLAAWQEHEIRLLRMAGSHRVGG